MALKLRGIQMQGIEMSSESGPLPSVGNFYTAASSGAPAGPPLHVTPTFSGTTYSFGFTDSFAPPNGPITGRTAETSVTSSVSPYTWNEGNIGVDTVSGGVMTMPSDGNPYIGVVDNTVEFNMPSGFYIEHKYDSTDANAVCIIHMEIGATILTFETGGTTGPGGTYDGHAFCSIQGPNGYGASTSDLWVSASPYDGRTNAIRVEVTSTLVTVYSGVSVIIRFTPRFDLQLFGSLAVAGSFAVAYWQANADPSASSASIDIDYVNVGAL